MQMRLYRWASSYSLIQIEAKNSTEIHSTVQWSCVFPCFVSSSWQFSWSCLMRTKILVIPKMKSSSVALWWNQTFQLQPHIYVQTTTEQLWIDVEFLPFVFRGSRWRSPNVPVLSLTACWHDHKAVLLLRRLSAEFRTPSCGCDPWGQGWSQHAVTRTRQAPGPLSSSHLLISPDRFSQMS